MEYTGLTISNKFHPRDEIASLHVDAQNTFTELCNDELPVKGGHEIVGELNKNATFASIHTASGDEHHENALHIATPEHPQLTPVNDPEHPDLDVFWKWHGQYKTYGWELLDGLPDRDKYDLFIRKGMDPRVHPYGACYHDRLETISTGLIEYYNYMKIRVIIAGGLAGDYCLRTSIKQLVKAEFLVILNLASTRFLEPKNKDAVCKELKDLGVIIVKDSTELKKMAEAS
jgi:nicotinamidase/pyrazinamidase